MTDAKADARALIRAKGLTGDDMVTLMRAAVHAFPDTVPDLEAAARRLAAPEAAEPVWPERVWAVFNDGGRWARATHTLDEAHAYRGEGYTILPARLIPADGSRVVLTHEDARRLRNLAAKYRAASLTSGEDEKGIAALDRALADTEGAA